MRPCSSRLVRRTCIVLSTLAAAAAGPFSCTTDGVTPDCSEPEAGCDPRFDGSRDGDMDALDAAADVAPEAETGADAAPSDASADAAADAASDATSDG